MSFHPYPQELHFVSTRCLLECDICMLSKGETHLYAKTQRFVCQKWVLCDLQLWYEEWYFRTRCTFGDFLFNDVIKSTGIRLEHAAICVLPGSVFSLILPRSAVSIGKHSTYRVHALYVLACRHLVTLWICAHRLTCWMLRPCGGLWGTAAASKAWLRLTTSKSSAKCNTYTSACNKLCQDHPTRICLALSTSGDCDTFSKVVHKPYFAIAFASICAVKNPRIFNGKNTQICADLSDDGRMRGCATISICCVSSSACGVGMGSKSMLGSQCQCRSAST